MLKTNMGVVEESESLSQPPAAEQGPGSLPIGPETLPSVLNPMLVSPLLLTPSERSD